MSGLTHAQCLTITRARVLAVKHAGGLSAFEVDLILDVADRYRCFGERARVTHHEWAVLDEALKAMTADRQRALAIAALGLSTPHTDAGDAAGARRGSHQPAA